MLGIYIQVPFCASKCSFCNFSSGVERGDIFDQYTRALLGELELWPRFFSSHAIPAQILSQPVDSVYMGGGTPALLGEERLRLIVGALRDRLRWTETVEFTLETTPGSADAGLLQAMRGMGINRLSIGAQTFDDRELRAVGRLHSVTDTVDQVRAARESGFQNISLDLIAGLPYQTEVSFRHSLEIVADLRPEHVSLYLFEVDDKSRLGREVAHGGDRYHAATVPGDEFMAQAYESGCAFLAAAGYVQYEISNFALPGFASRHNQKYWQLAPYLGLGAGAHSFDGSRRWSNDANVRSYMTKLDGAEAPIDDCRSLSAEEQVEECLFLGLRQVDGINLPAARERWGSACLKPWEDKIEALVQDGLLVRNGSWVRLANRAYLISNEIFQEFVSLSQ